MVLKTDTGRLFIFSHSFPSMAGINIPLEKPIPYIGITLIQIIWAIVIFAVGVVITKTIVYLFRKGIKKTKLPAILADFLSKLLAVFLYVIFLLMAVAALGFDVNSIILGISAIIGLILGFGLQDTFTNLAAGFWIALTRPFNEGDYVTTNGMDGTVKGIGVMVTELLTPDNKYIAIPNKLVWGSPIINYTRMKTRRVNVDIGVAYGTDIDQAVKIAMNLMKNEELILNEPEPAVVISELADSSINLQLRAWTKTENYWNLKGILMKKIYEEYGKVGIEIPYPQLDVHIRDKK